jgi:hypothetical protein
MCWHCNSIESLSSAAIMQRPNGLTAAEFANSLRWFLGRQEAVSLQYHPDGDSFALVPWLDHAIDAPKKCLAAVMS